MKVYAVSTALVLSIAAAYAPAVYGQKMAKATAMATAMVTAKDKTFMNVSGRSDLAEIAMANLAMKKSKDPQVLKYAQMMMMDHDKLHTELKSLAGQRKTVVPYQPNKEQMATKTRLSRLNGQKFDLAYFEAQVKGHKAAYANAVKASKTANDAAIRDYFAKGAPIIKKHLDMATMCLKDERMQSKTGMKKG